MRVSRAVLLFCIVAITVARMTSLPRYSGQVGDDGPDRWSAMSAPFGDDLRGSCNAFLSLLAVSLDREGFGDTGGIPLMNPMDVEPARFAYYDHHPPGVPWLTALAFSVFGTSELTARALALTLSTLTALLLALFVHRRAGIAAAAVTVVAIGSIPMGLYWSTHLNYEVPTIAFATLFLTLCLSSPKNAGP